MSTHQSQGWEPDPKRMGNWRAMFEQPRHEARQPGSKESSPTALDDVAQEDGVPGVDLKEYRPWLLQRGSSRPPMMLELRRFEPRSGLWQSWALSYPSLYAVECLGDRMLSLDFGGRHFVIEGRGLDDLARQLHRGSVMAIQEYCSAVWPEPPGKAVTTAIRQLDRKTDPAAS